MTRQDIDRCMENTGLIRHRAKLESHCENAKAYLAMESAVKILVILCGRS